VEVENFFPASPSKEVCLDEPSLPVSDGNNVFNAAALINKNSIKNWIYVWYSINTTYAHELQKLETKLLCFHEYLYNHESF